MAKIKISEEERAQIKADVAATCAGVDNLSTIQEKMYAQCDEKGHPSAKNYICT